jgi:hypothetical protein
MGEHIEQGARSARAARKRRPRKQIPQTLGRRLLYNKSCRIGGKLTLDDLAETEIGDWPMPDFKAACAYAASQGWLIVRDDTVTLTAAGLASA